MFWPRHPLLLGVLIRSQVHLRKSRGHNVEENNYGAEGSEMCGFTGSHAAGHTSSNVVLGYELSVIDTLTPHDTFRDISLESGYCPTVNGPGSEMA